MSYYDDSINKISLDSVAVVQQQWGIPGTSEYIIFTRVQRLLQFCVCGRNWLGLCVWGDKTRFWCMEQNWLGFSVGIEIDMVLVRGP